MADQFTPQERGLIERLQNAPQPDLSADRFQAIRAQVLQAMDAPPAPPGGLTPAVPIIGTIVIVIVIVVVIVLSGVFAPQKTEPTRIPSVTATPEATLEATEESTPETTPEMTLEATEEITPEETPESTEEAVIVIEGPVETIDGNIITIYDVPIQIDPTDPLLDTIQVGDVLHIEGDSGTTIITAITITYVDVEVNVNPTSGAVWRDDGTCANPPPDWAPANGWRRRCQGQTQSQGNGNNGNGMGMGDD